MDSRNKLPFLSPIIGKIKELKSPLESLHHDYQDYFEGQRITQVEEISEKDQSSPYFRCPPPKSLGQSNLSKLSNYATLAEKSFETSADNISNDEDFDLESFIEDRVEFELNMLDREAVKTPSRVNCAPPAHISIPEMTPRGSVTGDMCQLRSIGQVPKPFDQVFSSQFEFFNKVQSKVFPDALHSDKHLVLSSPTATGKSTIFELAIIRALLSAGSVSLYFAPMKSIVNERFRDWSQRFENIQGLQEQYRLRAFEWTGDTITNDCEILDFENSIQKYNLILTTPEKWDATSRRWGQVGRDFAKRIRLVMIDEVHLLNDKARGHTLEAVITRMKMTIAKENHLRFVAVSATIPNAEDIATWFSNPKAQDGSVCHNFGPELRPVPLRKVILGFPFDGKSHFKFEMNLNYKLPNIISTYSNSKPTLIFTHSRKSTQMTASNLAQKFHQNLSFEHRLRLQEASQMISNDSADHTKLKECLLAGVGFHHAGLTMRDRDIIEHLFRRGSLPILVSTTTLALGVNLPAHLVVVKSTSRMVDGIYMEYEESQILQMLGRAGRPQFDTSATAVILTTENQKHFYESLVGGSKAVESNVLNNLEEHLNAEIVLKVITDVAFALEWIRLLRDPQNYKEVTGSHRSKDVLKKRLDDYCVRALNGMVSAGLLEMDQTMLLKSTPAGGWMAKYYLAYVTVKEFLKYVAKDSSEDQITLSSTLNIICNCKELTESLQLRRDEKRYLNRLNGTDGKKSKNSDDIIRFPLGHRVKEREDKANVIIQSHLGCLDMHGESHLLTEGQKLIKVGRHLSQCLANFVSGLSKNYNVIKNALILTKCFKCGLWENTNYVSKQIKGIGISYSSALVHAGLTSFEKLSQKNPREIEMILCLPPPQGNRIRDFSKYTPKYSLDVKIEGSCGIIRCSRTINVLLSLSIANSSDIQGNSSFGRYHTSCLLAGNPLSGEIYFKQIIHDSNIKSGSFERRFPVTFFRDPEKNALEVSLISGSFSGADIYKRFSLGPMLPHLSEQTVNLEAKIPNQIGKTDGRTPVSSSANLESQHSEINQTTSVIESSSTPSKKKNKSKKSTKTHDKPTTLSPQKGLAEPILSNTLEWTSSFDSQPIENNHFDLGEPEELLRLTDSDRKKNTVPADSCEVLNQNHGSGPSFIFKRYPSPKKENSFLNFQPNGKAFEKASEPYPKIPQSIRKTESQNVPNEFFGNIQNLSKITETSNLQKSSILLNRTPKVTNPSDMDGHVHRYDEYIYQKPQLNRIFDIPRELDHLAPSTPSSHTAPRAQSSNQTPNYISKINDIFTCESVRTEAKNQYFSRQRDNELTQNDHAWPWETPGKSFRNSCEDIRNKSKIGTTLWSGTHKIQTSNQSLETYSNPMLNCMSEEFEGASERTKTCFPAISHPVSVEGDSLETLFPTGSTETICNPSSWFLKKNGTNPEKETQFSNFFRFNTDVFNHCSSVSTTKLSDTWSTPTVKRQRKNEE